MEEIIREIRCTNCSAPMTGKFCADCGQARFVPEQLSVRHFLNDSFREFFSIDNRLLRSLRPLLLEPGALTQNYIAGKHQQFIKPVSLFVFVNVLFFFFGYRAGLLNWKMSFANGAVGKTMIIAEAERQQVDSILLEEKLNDTLKEYQRSLFFGVIPLFAMAMKLICFRKRRSIVEFLIYSIHFHSSYLILLPVSAFLVVTVLGIVDKLVGTQMAIYIGNDPGLIYYAMTLMVLYHFLALRRIYHDGPVAALMQSLALSFAAVGIMIPLGQKVLFWLVWWSSV